MPATVQPPLRKDVLIVGAGPIGSLVAYQLARSGCDPYIVEQTDKPSAPIYGRATTLWPRSLEMYDALDLCDNLLEVGVVSKTGVNFKDGKIANGGLNFAHRLDKHGDTRFKFALHLRQRLTERAIEKGYAGLGHKIQFQHKLVAFKEDSVANPEYPVRCTMQAPDESFYDIECKYLVGADGGHSPVRKAAGIEFIGEGIGAKWIRMDALVETDMPSPRALNSVQSASHGLVLFAPIDAGRTRIGFVFSKELQEKYGEDGVTHEVAMAEAKKAVAPFKLDFVKVDWVTLYGIGQRIASEFIRGRVILAGDSAHAHSSGSAQGLNTGTFDACNLAWKLALELKGLAKSNLVTSYDDERRPCVQTVIDNDVIISSLISGRLPPQFAGRTEHPRDLLDQWFENRAVVEFTLGLGVSYPSNNLINRDDPNKPISIIVPGTRAPDVQLSRVGTGESIWLQRVIRNDGKFSIVTFTGQPSHTRTALELFQSYLSSDKSILKRFPAHDRLFKFASVIAGHGIGAEEYLGVAPVGMPYFDPLGDAHEVYGVDKTQGAIVVFRPDGYIATVLALQDAKLLGDHFARFLIEGATLRS